MTDKQEKVAVQANALIRANQQELTLTEKRIMLYLISMVKPEDEAFKYYRVKTSEFASMLPNDGNNETLSCMNACDALQDKKVKVEFDDHTTMTRLVLKSKYYVGQGYFDVLLDDELKPMLLQLKKHFTKIYIKHALQLTSVNAVRLYEILLSWGDKGKLITTPDQLKDMLGLTGKYKLFSQFKANCLTPAFLQIKEKTDIKTIRMTEKRKGRKVEQIVITFKQYPEEQIKERVEPIFAGETKPISHLSPETREQIVEEQIKKTETEKKLSQLGVINPNQFNLPDEVWEKAISQEGNKEGVKPSFIITTAKSIHNQMKTQLEEQEKKKKQDEIFKSNEKWWQGEEKNHSVSGSPPYLMPPKGKPILFNDPDFKEKVKDYRLTDKEIQDRRKKIDRRTGQKSLFTGTSLPKRGDERRTSQ